MTVALRGRSTSAGEKLSRPIGSIVSEQRSIAWVTTSPKQYPRRRCKVRFRFRSSVNITAICRVTKDRTPTLQLQRYINLPSIKNNLKDTHKYRTILESHHHTFKLSRAASLHQTVARSRLGTTLFLHRTPNSAFRCLGKVSLVVHRSVTTGPHSRLSRTWLSKTGNSHSSTRQTAFPPTRLAALELGQVIRVAFPFADHTTLSTIST